MYRSPWVTIIGIIAAVGVASPAGAATFNVDSSVDEVDAVIDGVCSSTPSGVCTLRAAVQEANFSLQGDTIVLMTGTYTLSLMGTDDQSAVGDLDILTPIQILGNNSSISSLQRTFDVHTGGDLILRDLTLSGQSGDSGGSIHNPFILRVDPFGSGNAQATAINCTFTPLPGPTSAFAITVGNGILRLEDSTLFLGSPFNYLVDILSIVDGSATLEIVNSQILQIDATPVGAIRSSEVPSADQDVNIFISNTTFDAIAAGPLNTGTVINQACGPNETKSLTIEDSTFQNFVANVSQQRIVLAPIIEPSAFDCTTSIRRSSFLNNDIGLRTSASPTGIAQGRLNILDSTFADNRIALEINGRLGGGNNGRFFAVADNITVSENTEFGIRTTNGGSLFMNSSTLTGNGVALSDEGAETPVLNNSILANSTTSDCEGQFEGEYNLLENSNCMQVNGNPATNLFGVDPLLGPLSNTGGSVSIHDLMATSPAIDGGNPTVPDGNSNTCTLFDAVGNPRPADGDTNGSFVCDMGAFERQGTPPQFDYGDAPDPSYPTLLASDAGRHLIAGGLFLGASVDADADGQPNANADGDDQDGNDDEDGVVLPASVNAGEVVGLDVTASLGGLLSMWLDINGDGDWADPLEELVVGAAVSPGVNSIQIAIPEDSQALDSFLRVRLASTLVDSPDGGIADGEVEDYALELRRDPAPNGDQDLIGDEEDGRFGRAIAELNGDLLISAPEVDRAGVMGAGAVQAYVRGSGGTVPTQSIVAPDLDPNEDNNRFGVGLALAEGPQGKYLAIGASRGTNPSQPNAGAVYLYRKDMGQWVFQQKLNAPRLSDTASQRFGEQVALDYDATAGVYTLAVGAPGHREPMNGTAQGGAVFLYQLNPFASFTLIDVACGDPTVPCGGFLFPPAGQTIQNGDEFGYSVAFRPNRLLISSPFMQTGMNLYPGQAFIFERAAVQGDGAYDWTFRATLGDPAPQDGESFGEDIVAAGSSFYVSAPYFDFMDGGSFGAVYEFSSDASSFDPPLRTIRPGGGGGGRGSDVFVGETLAADDDLLAVRVNGSCEQVYVYRIEPGVEVLLDIISSPADPNSDFGSAMAIDASTDSIFVGAPNDSVQQVNGVGSTFIFVGIGEVFADGFESSMGAKSAERGPGC